MGKTPLMQYPLLIKAAYMRWWGLMFSVNSISCSPLAIILYRIYTIIFGVIVIGDVITVFRRNRWNGILLLIMFLLFPVAANLMELMAPNYVIERMLYGFVMTFLLLLSLSEKLIVDGSSIIWHKIIKKLYFWVSRSIVTLVMVGLISVYVYYANVEYFRMDFLQSQAKSYFTTLISQIKSADGYKAGMPVVFIGKHSNVDLDQSFKGVYYNAVPYSDYGEVGDLVNSYTWVDYMRRWCGFSPIIGNANDYSNISEVAKMSVYPDDGSIKVVDDVLIVKLSQVE